MAATVMFAYIMSLFPAGGIRTLPQPQSTVETTRKSSVNSNSSFRTASEMSASVKAEEAAGPRSANPSHNSDLESQTTMVNRTTTPLPKPAPSFATRLRTWIKPSDRTIYNAILGTSDGMTVPFVVMASLAGVSNARLVMLAGLAELIGGAVSMGAGGILGAKSDEERHCSEMRYTTKLVDEHPGSAPNCLIDSIADDLPPAIVTAIESHYHTLSAPAKVQLIMRFHMEPDPCPADTYKAAATFFFAYFSGLPALIPYIVVQEDQVNLAFYISIGITTFLSFAYGWAKTGYNVGWTGSGNIGRCIQGGLAFFGVIAVASALSVVIVRGIDHNL